MLFQTRAFVWAALFVFTASSIDSSRHATDHSTGSLDDPAEAKVARMTVGTKFRKHFKPEAVEKKASDADKEGHEKAEAGKGTPEEKKGDAKEGAEKEGDEKSEHSGVLMAISMFCTICLLSVVIGMASAQNKIVNSHTWFVLDQVILIFIAVMNYQAFGDVSEYFLDRSSHKIIAAAFQAFGLFLVAFYISWKMKSHPVALAIFCGAGAHFVSFASIHLTEVVQDHFSGDEHLWRKLGVFAAFAAVFFAFSAGIYILKQRAHFDDDAWNDSITDTENDFIAMALAVVWTTFMFHLIMGKDRELEVEPDEARKIRQHEELMVLAYAIVMIPFAVLLNRRLGADTGASMIMQRLTMFFSAFCAMASCWGFLFLAQMHFYSNFCSTRPLFCRIVFATVSNLVAVVAILLLAKISEKRLQEGASDRALGRDVTVALTAFSLGAAWAWEQTFDAAMESMADHFEHKAPHLKVGLSLFLVAVMLPTYVTYIKPVVIEKTKCLG